MSQPAVEPAFPTVTAIQALESRQDEVLRQLDELEQQVLAALKTFGESRWSEVLGVESAIFASVPHAITVAAPKAA